MTQNLEAARNIEIASSAGRELNLLGVAVTKISIASYYKFDQAWMITLELDFEKELLSEILIYLDELSDSWFSTHKTNPTQHRMLDLRGRGAIYSDVIWGSFDIV